MTDQWPEGNPESDGLYACIIGTSLHAVRRVGHGMDFVSGEYLEIIGDIVTRPILRHIRLPEPPRPLELPRRFRAKYGSLDVVGVRGVPGRLFAIFDKNGYVGFKDEHELTDLVWEDDQA